MEAWKHGSMEAWKHEAVIQVPETARELLKATL